MLSTSTVCGGRKYFVDMTIKTFCRLIKLFSSSLLVATRKQWEHRTPVEKKPALGWWCLWTEVLELAPTCGGRGFHPGCWWELGNVPCLALCCCAKGIAASSTAQLTFLRVLALLLWSPMLFLSSSCLWPPPAFSGCGHTNGGIASWHRRRKEVRDGGEPCLAGQPWTEQALSPSQTNPMLETHCYQQWFPPPPKLYPGCWLPHWPGGTSGGGGTNDCSLGWLSFYRFLPDLFIHFTWQRLPAVLPWGKMTNPNSCWFLWTFQVPRREAGLSRNTKVIRLLRAEEWQKCPHVFCLWHCCWWESHSQTSSGYTYTSP